MASAKLTRALAEGNVTIQRAPSVGGEVLLTFRPLVNRVTGAVEQPGSISITNWRPVEPLKRSGVTLENLRNSNLDDLVRRGVIVLVTAATKTPVVEKPLLVGAEIDPDLP